MVSLETTDLFKGTFLMCSGGDLAEVRVRNNGGRRIATFLITRMSGDVRDVGCLGP